MLGNGPLCRKFATCATSLRELYKYRYEVLDLKKSRYDVIEPVLWSSASESAACSFDASSPFLHVERHARFMPLIQFPN